MREGGGGEGGREGGKCVIRGRVRGGREGGRKVCYKREGEGGGEGGRCVKSKGERKEGERYVLVHIHIKPSEREGGREEGVL